MSHQAHFIWPTEAHLKSPLGFDSPHLGGLQLLVLSLCDCIFFLLVSSFVFSRELLIPSLCSAAAAAA